MTSFDKGPGYMSTEVVGCQFSVYPLRQEDIDGPVQASVHAAVAGGCAVRVGNLSTLISGSEDQVFAALRAAQNPISRVIIALPFFGETFARIFRLGKKGPYIISVTLVNTALFGRTAGEILFKHPQRICRITIRI